MTRLRIPLNAAVLTSTEKKKLRPGTTGYDLIVLAVVVPLRALFLMLGLGVLHNDWTPQVPALGFWASLVVSLMITGVLRR